MSARNHDMRAIRFHDYGEPDQLVLEEVPQPGLESGKVLVRVHAAGVNPWDWKLRAGQMRQFMPVKLPYVPGIEMAGIVEAIGPGVTAFANGDAVFGRASGAYAEYVVAPEATLALKPRSLSFDQAASVPIGATTAWMALFDEGDLQAGQRVLIHGAAGGVGQFAVQLARWKGAHVTGTASADNIEYVRWLGAEEVIDYRATPFESVVKDVDLVLDTVGGDVLERSWKVLRPAGILVSIAGQPSQEEARAHNARAATVQGARANPAHTGELLRKIADLIDSGDIKVQVTNTFPLSAAREAQALSERRHGRGRIVLHVSD